MHTVTSVVNAQQSDCTMKARLKMDVILDSPVNCMVVGNSWQLVNKKVGLV